MGGPIVRTGTTPKFWENWENVFGKKQGGAAKKAGKAPAKKSAAKQAVAKKKSKKGAGKKK